MTNREEREEVAKKLRGAKEQLEKEGFYGYTIWYRIEPELFELIYEIVCGKSDGDYNDIFVKLADLIDPTCHDFGGEEGTNGESYDFACSTCGLCGDVTKPNYCPHCGARVVIEDA